jgi:hypothetical protein
MSDFLMDRTKLSVKAKKGRSATKHISVSHYLGSVKGVMDLFNSQQIYYKQHASVRDETREGLRAAAKDVLATLQSTLAAVRRQQLHGKRGRAAVGEIVDDAQLDDLCGWGLDMNDEGTVIGAAEVKGLQCGGVLGHKRAPLDRISYRPLTPQISPWRVE